jgi:hypothetical protein
MKQLPRKFPPPLHSPFCILLDLDLSSVCRSENIRRVFKCPESAATDLRHYYFHRMNGAFSQILPTIPTRWNIDTLGFTLQTMSGHNVCSKIPGFDAHEYLPLGISKGPGVPHTSNLFVRLKKLGTTGNTALSLFYTLHSSPLNTH